jgi:hypothetical protein
VSSSFIRKLRREITANPKKAGALGVLLLVALCFWAPLVAKWFSGPASDPSNATTSPPATAAATVAATTSIAGANVNGTPSPDKSKTPTWSWQQLVRWMEKDPNALPAIDLGGGRDPFGPSRADLAAKEQKESAPAPEQTPGDAGLVLNSTIVGLGENVALIGGESYKVGSLVPAHEGEGGFRLVEIRPRQVILDRQGKRYELNLETTEVARNKDSKDPSTKDNSPYSGGKLQK